MFSTLFATPASEAIGWIIALALVLFGTFLLLRSRSRRSSASHEPETWILVDGSNVMHWQDNTALLLPVRRVIEQLKELGFTPGVVFDANAGWKLEGRYLHDGDLARRLNLEHRQVLVVPKGTQADPYLLDTAREFGARIVTNDRYRDWVEAYPIIAEPGFLIRGGMRDGKVWLAGLESAKTTDASVQS